MFPIATVNRRYAALTRVFYGSKELPPFVSRIILYASNKSYIFCSLILLPWTAMGNLKTCDGTVYQPKPHVCEECGKRLCWQAKGRLCLEHWWERRRKDPEIDWKKQMAYVRSFRGKK